MADIVVHRERFQIFIFYFYILFVVDVEFFKLFKTCLEFTGLGVHRELVKVHGTHEANPRGDYIQHLSR